MHTPRLNPGLLAACLLAGLLLAGCSAGVRPGAAVPDVRVTEQARQLADAGDYPGAAAVYLDAADRADPPLQDTYRLAAIDTLVLGGELARAALVIDGLPVERLTAAQRQRLQLARARIALAGDDPEQVLALLAEPPSGDAAADAWHELRGKALVATGEYAAGAAEFIRRNAFIIDPEARLENQLLTWEAVNQLEDADLQRLRTAPPPDAFSGWLELVELTRLYLQQPDALAGVLPHWQMRYPAHPAGERFLAELQDGMRAAGLPPEQVAVLLPLGGKLAGVASAIRDGLLTAWYDTPQGVMRPAVRVYDTGGDPALAPDIVRQAVQEGARFIIGPLRKEAVGAVLQQEDLAVPVLALNQVDMPEGVGAAIYQFGLAPEDEARAVAERAMADGHRRALALVPEGDWGERVFAAFADEWARLGGHLLELGRYDAAETDHGGTITAALNLDSSRARKQRLVRLLGRQLEFEPRRRQDVDFIFLLATPKQARLIRPQLSFFRASRVPVYSTSHVFTGQPDRDRDIDLNGLKFCDLPWILDAEGNWAHLKRAVDEHWPATARRYGRFYALGIDAWQVMPYLGQLEGGMFGTFQGATGNLALDRELRLRRAPRWAQFRNGLPVPLETVAADETAPGDRLP